MSATEAALVWRDLEGGDIALSGFDLLLENSLRTAVIISLFTDRRAASDAPGPGVAADKRGWWGDLLADVPQDRIGSQLWLLAREKQTREVAERARGFALEALAWLVEDGAAARIEAFAEWIRTGVLALEIVIHKPPLAPIKFRFNGYWENV